MYMLLYKCKSLRFNETARVYSCMCFTQNSVHAQSVHTHMLALMLHSEIRLCCGCWPAMQRFLAPVLWQSTSHLPGREGNLPDRTSAELVLAPVLLRLQRDPVRDAIFALSCQLWN